MSAAAGTAVSAAAGTVQEGRCPQQWGQFRGDSVHSSRDRENQRSQRLRTNHNLPSYQFCVRRAKAIQQPPQGMRSLGPESGLVSINI